MSDNRRYEWHPGQRGEDIAIYEYQGEDGTVLFRKVKTATGDPKCPKLFRTEVVRDGRWTTGPGILDSVKKVPFRLPRLLVQARDTFGKLYDRNPSCVICEGEKDALALAELGFVSTCCHCGANTWPPEITPYFKDKLCYILYDVDTLEGRHNPERVAAALWGTAREIRIADLLPFFTQTTDLRELHELDASDYLSRFATAPAKISGVRELLRAARVYTPPETV